MSSLFNDPINTGLAQFDHTQSKKTTNKISMYLLTPFILQNFKKILRDDPELRGCAIFGPKMTHLSWKKFLCTNHYYFIYLLALFTVQNFKKIQRIQSYEDACFGPQMVHLPQTKIFFWKKLLISFSSTYWPFWFCKILKKFLKFVERIQIYLWCAIFRPKIPQFVLNKSFWYKPLLLLSSHYWSFSLGKIKKKNSDSKSRVMRMHHF